MNLFYIGVLRGAFTKDEAEQEINKLCNKNPKYKKVYDYQNKILEIYRGMLNTRCEIDKKNDPLLIRYS